MLAQLGRNHSMLRKLREQSPIRGLTVGNLEAICEAVIYKKEAEKGSIIILAALVLSGGGKRPQVYAQLNLPEESELEKFEAKSRKNKQYFTLRTGL